MFKQHYCGVLLLASLLGTACNSDKKVNFQEYVKNYPTDPYQDALPKSQFFEIDNSKDNVIQGEDGTVIVLPAGCFVDKDGNPVQGKVRIELAEAVGATHQIRANLTGNDAQGKPMQNAASAFINATVNGQQVAVNPDNPLYIEMPNPDGDADLEVFSGTRDAQGNMTWKNPIAAVKYLTTYPLSSLRFYPEGFEATVEAGMPFRQHTKATKALKDSLYFSMAVYPNGIPFWRPNVHDPTYNLNQFTAPTTPQDTTAPTPAGADYHCGINPSVIQTLQDKRFENTLIATREFEERLQVMFKICATGCDTILPTGKQVLDIYIQNLDKNMWELDEMAMRLFPDTTDRCFAAKPYRSFRAFAKQRLTNVRDAPKNAQILRDYYAKTQTENQQRLEATQAKFKDAVDKENQAVIASLDEYRALLKQRWVPTIKATTDNMGWIGTGVPVLFQRAYEVQVPDYTQYDRVHAYTVIPDKNRLYDMDSGDQTGLFIGSVNRRAIPDREVYPATAIVVAYRQNAAFLYTENITLNTGTPVRVITKLRPVSTAELNTALAAWDTNASRENKLTVELEYQYQWAVQRKKQQKDFEEWQFLQRCWEKAYPCCPILWEK